MLSLVPTCLLNGALMFISKQSRNLTLSSRVYVIAGHAQIVQTCVSTFLLKRQNLNENFSLFSEN